MRLEVHDERLYNAVARLLSYAHTIQYPRNVEERVLSAIFQSNVAARPDDNTVALRVTEHHCGQPVYENLLIFGYTHNGQWGWVKIPSPQYLEEDLRWILKHLPAPTARTNVCVNPFYFEVIHTAPRNLFIGLVQGVEYLLKVTRRSISMYEQVFMERTKPQGVYVTTGDVVLVELNLNEKCMGGIVLWWIARDLEGRWTVQSIEEPRVELENIIRKAQYEEDIDRKKIFEEILRAYKAKELKPWVHTF